MAHPSAFYLILKKKIVWKFFFGKKEIGLGLQKNQNILMAACKNVDYRFIPVMFVIITIQMSSCINC